LAELRLALAPGVGPKTRKSLLARFGSASAALDAAPSELREAPGVGPKLCRTISSAKDEIDAEGELELCRKNRIAILIEGQPEYPRLLREIPDPPGVLFCLGELVPRDALCIAIVGTRHATRYGIRQSEQLAMGLSRAGLTIVSGLARGIDAAAHRGALAAGGRTVAVLAGGVLNVFPPEHQELAEQIVRSGALLSEARPCGAPKSGMFPQRNRLITGLSLGVIVVEAAQRSGALISAGHALEQGREVFAVPGRADYRTSRGCHRLIREGAKLVESVDDVLEELGPLVETATQDAGRVIHHPAELQLNEQEQSVLEAVGAAPTLIDQVAANSRLPVHRVLATISVLETRRLVRRVSGNLVERA
jgi:DNA processing protein